PDCRTTRRRNVLAAQSHCRAGVRRDRRDAVCVWGSAVRAGVALVTLPTVQMERTSQAALDLEAGLRDLARPYAVKRAAPTSDLARTYALTTAEQLYVLATVTKAILRPILDAERKAEPNARA